MFRAAKLKDARAIKKLIDEHGGEDVLKRSLMEICEDIRGYIVGESDGKIIACCNLHIFGEDLGELRTLVVHASYRRRGIASNLVKRVLREARKLGVKKVFSLTTIPVFFQKLGFKKINRAKLHAKVWSECVKCPKFPKCDEEAMIIEL
ncbi:MAG: N-acetyltransferase [Methanocellales archaeon]